MFWRKRKTDEQLSDIESLGLQEIELADLRQGKSDELRRAEKSAGEEYFESRTSVGNIDGIPKLQKEIDAIDRAINLLRSDRPELIRAANLVQAHELRKQATERL